MLADLITRGALEQLAGITAFRRGEDYFASGAVSRLHLAGQRLTARVEGTHPYQVELREQGGRLGYGCTCPRAADGYFCKHCVAVGLAWLANGASAGAIPDPFESIAAYLRAQPVDKLVSLLLETAQRDDRLYQVLSLKAERANPNVDQVKALRRAIDKATETRGFVDWKEAGDFAADVDLVIDGLEEFLTPESAETLVDLVEHGMQRLEVAIEQVDDSNGELSGPMDRLSKLHLDACKLAALDPLELAEHLFALETEVAYEYFSFYPLTYRDALGDAGLRRYRELAEVKWRTVEPRMGKGDYDPDRARITHLMESLAKASDDVDELVSIRSRDLSSAYSYLGIAELLAKAGRPEAALEWAERGLTAFPERTDNRLRDFVVAAYLDLGRHLDALQLTWIQFEERPDLEQFKKLQQVAERGGVWPEQRERALRHLQETILREANTTTRWKPEPSVPNYSIRVQIALWESDLDAAWEAAHQGLCNMPLLVDLAKALESSRPEDAISLYRRVVIPTVEQTNNHAYEEAARLIRRIGELMKALGQTREFSDYLTELGARFKPKRNFMKLLDGIAKAARG